MGKKYGTSVIYIIAPFFEQGIKYLFVPDWAKLADLNVWRAAAGQVNFAGLILLLADFYTCNIANYLKIYRYEFKVRKVEN